MQRLLLLVILYLALLPAAQAGAGSGSKSTRPLEQDEYFIATGAEKVVIFLNGEFVCISVDKLIGKQKSVVELGKNVRIDQGLLDKIFRSKGK